MAPLVIWQQSPFGWLFSMLVFVVHLAVVARAIVRPDRTPTSRIAWVAVIMTLPLVGIVAYLFIGETSIGRDRVKKLRAVNERMRRPDEHPDNGLDVPERAVELFDLGRTINASSRGRATASR